MPEIPDVSPLDTISVDWGNDIRDRTVQRYSSVANRTSEHPSPSEGDLSYLTDSNTAWQYNGSTWVELFSGAIDTADITDNAVTAAKIATNTITNAEIGPDAVTVSELADGAVSGSKASGSLAAALLQGGGDMDVTFGALTTSFVDKAAVAFTKPASWGSYRITAWGYALITGSGNGEARIELGASNGATADTDITPSPIGCFHTVDTSTSPITVAIACREVGADANHVHSYVSYLAYRLT